MSRNLNASVLAKLAENNYTIVNLITFYIDAGVDGNEHHYTDYQHDITWNSNLYTATFGVMGVSDITEEQNFSIQSVNISMSAVPSENVKLFLGYDYIDRRVTVHRALLDTDNTIIGTPFLVFDGRIDQPIVKEDFQSRTATLGVSASSHWVDFDSQNGRHTNNTEQQVLHPGDEFFSFATETQRDIKWGRA